MKRLKFLAAYLLFSLVFFGIDLYQRREIRVYENATNIVLAKAKNCSNQEFEISIPDLNIKVKCDKTGDILLRIKENKATFKVHNIIWRAFFVLFSLVKLLKFVFIRKFEELNENMNVAFWLLFLWTLFFSPSRVLP
jgi:hypothetical protein